MNLTKHELQVLITHWERNLDYGVGGTFGDGEKFDSKADFKTAERILEKLKAQK